jgi:hypothetical protein
MNTTPLIPQEILSTLPGYGATDQVPCEEKVALVRLYSPYNGWSWYLVEMDPLTVDPTGYCFGLVCGFETEWGPWTVQEMEETNRSIPGAVVYDTTFTPTMMENVAAFHRRNGDLFGQPWGEGQ